MNLFAIILNTYCYISQVSCFINVSTLDDYYLSYDYDVTNMTSNRLVKSDSLLFPVPETIDSKYTLDVLPNIELPDDSLADTDLRDHDFIDNLMYVYYGSHNSKSVHSYGPEIIIAGCVLSCAAQLLTIINVFLKKSLNFKKDTNNMFLHLMGCLCLSNLFFMLGVYATKSIIHCQILAVILHYFHLLTAFWIFLYCYFIYKSQFMYYNHILKLRYLLSFAYGLPAVYSFISFIVAPKNYETKKFCFVSVQNGMIINYMLPVSLLLMITTIYSLNGIRKVNLELSKFELTNSAESLNALRNETEHSKKQDIISENSIVSLRECKNCLKILCLIQTSFDIVWFIAVLALENINHSNSMSIVYSVLSVILNWYIFAKTKSFMPSLVTAQQFSNEQFVTCYPDKDITSRRDSSDSIPLLVNLDNSTEMKDLRHDLISTISS